MTVTLNRRAFTLPEPEQHHTQRSIDQQLHATLDEWRSMRRRGYVMPAITTAVMAWVDDMLDQRNRCTDG